MLPVSFVKVEPDHSEATMLTYQILAAHGQKLIESRIGEGLVGGAFMCYRISQLDLIQGFISLPYDMIMESSSVFWELVHYYTEVGVVKLYVWAWLHLCMCSCSLQSSGWSQQWLN